MTSIVRLRLDRALSVRAGDDAGLLRALLAVLAAHPATLAIVELNGLASRPRASSRKQRGTKP